MTATFKITSAMALGFASVLVSLSVARAEDPVRILSGGPSSFKLLSAKEAEIEKAIGTQLDLKVQPNDIGMVALSNDLVDGFIGGRPESLFKQGEKRGMKKQNPDDYQWTKISEVVLKIGVHPDNPVKALTKEQISDILAGKITTWEPITGQKTPLKILIAKAYAASYKLIQDHYNGGKEVTTAQFVHDKDGLLRFLQKEPGALGFFTDRDSLGGFTPKFLSTEASRETGLLMKKKARPAALKFYEYIKAMPQSRQD